MNEIWTLVVCLGFVFSSAPGSAQDSSRTLYLISTPEVVHAGTPTSLAVTFLADIGQVVAEVAHGSTKVTQMEYFQGGTTRVLTVPPIPGPITHGSLLNLTVRGYRMDDLSFTNTTTLSFSLRNVTTFIQTDSSRYRPGDTLKVRVVSVQWDNHPYKGQVDITIQDPSGNTIDRWASTGNLGIVLREFTLSQASPLGQWAITATVNVAYKGVTENRVFVVEQYERPPFEVLFKTSSRVLDEENITGSVRALYPSGQPVQGTLTVSVTLVSAHHAASPATQTQTKEIYGSTQFFFSNDLLQALYSSPGFSRDDRLHISTCVTDNSTGFKVNKTAEVQRMENTFLLEFHNFPATLKPSLHFSSQLRISRYDRKPLSSVDLMNPAVIEVTQRTSTEEDVTTTLTLAVPEDGNIHIKFELQNQIVILFLRARFHSSEENLSVYNNNSSPTGSYIQISSIDTLPAQMGSPLQLNVESTFQPTKLHFVVSSRGQLVDAGTKLGTGTSSSFSLTPTVSWSPEACVTVYCILPDGEVTSDTARIPINQHNYVSLHWSSDNAAPGEQVSLTVTTLERGSQVGIVVMGTHGDALQTDPDLRAEQDCDIRKLTNGRLNEKKQADKPKNGQSDLMVEKYWSLWMDATESLLWLDTNISERTWTSEKITVPDGVSSLNAFALVMSDNLGLGFTPVPQKLSVSKDFSLSLDVPSHLIRGEEIVLEVKTINHLDHDIEVIILVAQSEAFEFVLADRGDVSVVNAQKLKLASHVSASALFPIRPVALGIMEISVDAVSAGASDSLVWRVLVKPEGVERSFSKTVFLELPPATQNVSRTFFHSFSFPPHVVPGSQKAHVALVGEILTLSINNLNSLVQRPLGCGEQNMIHFAPSVYILQYLDLSAEDDNEIRSRAQGYMMEGYQRQLSYQRDDGSFSAFGASDASGSTWLTAFVLRCFLQGQTYMQVDQSVLTRATTWLLTRQGPQGEFIEGGRLIHTEMQGGLDNGTVALTAYVLIALLEDEGSAEMFADPVSQARMYLEDRVSSGGISNYSLCLVAYALSLANSPTVGAVLAELSSRADNRDGIMIWSSTAGLESHDWQPRSAQIEMTSYVLLAFFRRGSFVEGIPLMKWLSQQRNHLGGYGTTQDTVVALQALAQFTAFTGANAINLLLNMSVPATSFVSLFRINSTTYRTYQSQEIDANKDINITIYMEGIGFAVFQMNMFYNLESKAFSQNLQEARDTEAFSLDVHVAEETDSHMRLSICMKLKDSQSIPRTGMVILDVGMLSGFSLSPGAAASTDLIRKVEVLPEKVTLYLDSLNKTEVCITLPVVRNFKVAHIQDAVVQVYDYYEPTRKATRTYNSGILHNVNSCFYCGDGCDRCRPGIILTVSSSLMSRSVGIATYSWIGLFVGVSLCFIGV